MKRNESMVPRLRQSNICILCIVSILLLFEVVIPVGLDETTLMYLREVENALNRIDQPRTGLCITEKNPPGFHHRDCCMTLRISRPLAMSQIPSLLLQVKIDAQNTGSTSAKRT